MHVRNDTFAGGCAILLVGALVAAAGWPLGAVAQERMVLAEEFTATG
jgi:hypothetical protein